VGQVDACNPVQVPWSSATEVGDASTWHFTQSGHYRTSLAPYDAGALLGIKSKHGTLGGAGYFAQGSGIVFEDVAWTEHSRVVFRDGTNGAEVLDSFILRSPSVHGQAPCMSTPEGGPQFGQPSDPPSSGHVVDNLTADSTGDDSVAFFRATGTVTHSSLANSFSGRCVMEYESDVSVDSYTTDHLSNCSVIACGGDAGLDAD